MCRLLLVLKVWRCLEGELGVVACVNAANRFYVRFLRACWG